MSISIELIEFFLLLDDLSEIVGVLLLLTFKLFVPIVLVLSFCNSLSCFLKVVNATLLLFVSLSLYYNFFVVRLFLLFISVSFTPFSKFFFLLFILLNLYAPKYELYFSNPFFGKFEDLFL